MSLDDLSVSRKLSLAFGVVTVAVLAMCGTVFLLQQASIRATHTNALAYKSVDDIDRVIAGLYDQNASARGLVLYKQSRFAKKYADAGTLILGALQDARKNAEGQAEALQNIDNVTTAAQRWQGDIGDRIVALGGNPDTIAAATMVASSDHASVFLNDFRAAAKRAGNWFAARSVEAQATQDRVDDAVRNVLALGALAVLAFMAAAAVWLTRSIAHPIVDMTRAMKRLAAGDNTIVVPMSQKNNEIADMAGAVQTFKDAALTKIRLEQEALDARRLADGDREQHAAANARAAQQQVFVVECVATGLERLSLGDLMYRLGQNFAPEYEQLRANFNDTMAKLQDTMKIVAGNTSAIRSGTEQISTEADDLSRRTEQQAANLEETASALDEITDTVRKTAEGALHAKQVVGTTKGDAQRSGEVVREAVDAMKGIQHSSRQITQIIGVIDEIAFQTNLLALNAGVEAARAGEAGRGFAVVASEVRALAQRSAEAAKEIKSLISTSSQQVEAGVSLVAKTGDTLQRIAGQITEINDVVSDIAAAAQEQAGRLQLVNTSISHMGQMTQQNAAMVEESTAASHSLAQETEQLACLISRFQVGQHVAAVAPRRSSPTSASLPVPSLKTVGRGGAATKPKAQPQANDWEEF